MLISEVLTLPEKQWTPDADPVMATLMSVSPYKTDQYGYKQPVILKDDTQASTQIIVQTKFPEGLMTENMIGIKARWCCKWYAGRGGNQVVGYCLDKMQAQGQPIAAPQPPQAAPASPQSPKLANPQYDKNTSIERQCAFKAACNRAQGMKWTDGEIIALAMAGQYFIETGYSITDVPDIPSGDLLSKPTLNEEVPWEQT